MKVLLINHRFFPAEGGTERWTLGLARSLVHRGNEVTVLTQQEPGVPPEEVFEGIHVVRLGMRRWGRFRIPAGYWRTLKGLDYDILHLSGNRIWCADFYFPLAPVFDGPQVVTPHDFYQLAMNPSFLNRVYFERYLAGRLKAFDAYLALTDAEADRVTRWGYPLGRMRVVGEGIDRVEFEGHEVSIDKVREKWSLSHPIVALYVGGLWENKRVDRIVRSMEPVKDRMALVIVGRDVPGSMCDREKTTALAGRLGVEVKFLGAGLSRTELLAAYRSADLYVQGSQYEGFGLSVLEAMASGLPFVAFDAGAARRLAQSGGGRVVTTEAEFSRSLRELAADPTLREGMAKQARSEARRWDWDVVVDHYLAVYREVLTSRRPASG